MSTEKTIAGLALVAATLFAPLAHAAPLTILTNHLGYDLEGSKRAVLQGHGGDQVRSCALEDLAGGPALPAAKPQRVGAVAHWRDWIYWTVDFDDLKREGTFRLACATGGGPVRSFPFLVQRNLLERHTLSNVIYYFKGQRSSGALDEADHALPLEGRPGTRVDAHGGWFDATGDYGKHLSHLSFSTYFNPQQIPLTAWGLVEAYDLLRRRGDVASRQMLRRLADEAAWGADYLVRVKAPGGSFYRSVGGPGPEKRPADRRIDREAKGMSVKTAETKDRLEAPTAAANGREYQSSLRAGAGLSIAALARAAALGVAGERRKDYLRSAEEAWSFLAANNATLTNDGRENIVDDESALLAATELFLATHKPAYKTAADDRAARLLARLAPAPRAYWHADDKDRPFFHPADAGLPVVSLLRYLEVADPQRKTAVRAAVRASLEWELAVTAEVANPFGYARQLVQTKAGTRDTRFFFPHDAETAPWWQGENARLASLAFAARRAAPLFAGDAAFVARLRRYAQDQLDWILGRNPFDASMLGGTGRNNPEYMFFDSYEYVNAPGGICNGITAGFKDPQEIDFALPYAVTGADHDWRWEEQWLPHATWYLLAAAAGDPAGAERGRAIVAYVFAENKLVNPAEIAADKLTHINYAFANIADGKVVAGFAHDTENLKALTGLRVRHPGLLVLISVGGWTWSGAFSDAALTPASRRRFVDSAVAFVRLHDLDGLDIDWEFPDLPGYGNRHRPEDKQNFTALMADLRTGLDAEAKRRHRPALLTFAAGAFPDFLAHTEIGKVQASVDMVNLMTYDFREAGEDALAGHHANLYDNPADPKKVSVDRMVREYLAAGVPPHKLVVGVPFYGRAWAEVKPIAHGLYQPGLKPKERVDTSYANVVGQLIPHGGFVRLWDGQAQAPFLWNADKRIFISYEDPESLRAKSRFILDHDLGGAMFWEYYSDRTGVLLDTLATQLRPGSAAAARD